LWEKLCRNIWVKVITLIWFKRWSLYFWSYKVVAPWLLNKVFVHEVCDDIFWTQLALGIVVGLNLEKFGLIKVRSWEIMTLSYKIDPRLIVRVEGFLPLCVVNIALDKNFICRKICKLESRRNYSRWTARAWEQQANSRFICYA